MTEQELKDLENRFSFHPADTVKGMTHDAIRKAHFELASLVKELTPGGREQSLAITKLEEAMMWANAAIARNNKETELTQPHQFMSDLKTNRNNCLCGEGWNNPIHV